MQQCPGAASAAAAAGLPDWFINWLSLDCDFAQCLSMLFLLALLVSCHLIHLPKSCPIWPMWCWGDKKGSANALVLPHGSEVISEALCFCCMHIPQSRYNLPYGCVHASPLLCHFVDIIVLFSLCALFSCVTFSWVSQISRIVTLRMTRPKYCPWGDSCTNTTLF